MPGPHCKAREPYKPGLGFGWVVGCSCGWNSYQAGKQFPTKAAAKDFHKRHKNEADEALPIDIQRAIITLSDYGLIKGDYGHLRAGLEQGSASQAYDTA